MGSVKSLCASESSFLLPSKYCELRPGAVGTTEWSNSEKFVKRYQKAMIMLNGTCEFDTTVPNQSNNKSPQICAET